MMLRHADLSDVQDIFEWRNDVYSRQMFVNNAAVTLEEHIDWYERSLKSPHRKFYIGMVQGEKVGVVRFDLDVQTNESEVSINVNPKFRGLGYGFILLSRSINLYHQSGKVTLIAKVKRENVSSLRIFAKCDFHKNCEDQVFVYLSKN